MLALVNVVVCVLPLTSASDAVSSRSQQHDWFFSHGQLDKEEKVRPGTAAMLEEIFSFSSRLLFAFFFCPQAPEDKRDTQPVPNIDHLLSNIGRPGMPGEASGESSALVSAANLTFSDASQRRRS